MRSVQVTLMLNSGGVRVAPMLTDLFWYCMPDGSEILADPWNSLQPVSSKIRRRFLSVIPPPDKIVLVLLLTDFCWGAPRLSFCVEGQGPGKRENLGTSGSSLSVLTRNFTLLTTFYTSTIHTSSLPQNTGSHKFTKQNWACGVRSYQRCLPIRSTDNANGTHLA